MASGGDYNFIDRTLHHLAFSTPIVQKVLYELEDDLFGSKIESVRSDREVFVTGLPRSGTTVVLNLLYGTGEFSAFTYRHMPFVMSPLIWAKISTIFHKPAEKKQRAHGDGMEVSFDSPEAFEEIVWLAFLKDKIVKSATLSPISPDSCTAEFAEAFRVTIRKLIYLDGAGSDSLHQRRYLSKNNANISRLGLIAEVFPRAKILVPFRHPFAHVSSLMKQHELFTQRHKGDKFSKRYMEWLGHYEFGANFRPIDFDQWLGGEVSRESIDHDFWLRYWTVADNFILENKSDAMCLVDFDELLKNAETSLDKIGEHIGLRDKTRLVGEAQTLRSPTSRPSDAKIFRPGYRDAAFAVYEPLRSDVA
jgi:hypothetical protein